MQSFLDLYTASVSPVANKVTHSMIRTILLFTTAISTFV